MAVRPFALPVIIGKMVGRVESKNSRNLHFFILSPFSILAKRLDKQIYFPKIEIKNFLFLKICQFMATGETPLVDPDTMAIFEAGTRRPLAAPAEEHRLEIIERVKGPKLAPGEKTSLTPEAIRKLRTPSAPVERVTHGTRSGIIATIATDADSEPVSVDRCGIVDRIFIPDDLEVE